MALVVDLGSFTTKAGFAGDEGPRLNFSTVVGHPRFQSESQEVYVGDEATSKRSVLKLSSPIEFGAVSNWDDIELIWRHVYSGMEISTEDRNVLIAEAPVYPKAGRERMAQLMFETLNCPGLNFYNQAILSLAASGRSTGLVCESGHDVSYIVPINDSQVLSDAISRFTLAGRGLTSYLRKLLVQKGYDMNEIGGRDTVLDIKQTLCYVAEDYEADLATASSGTSLDRTYELPDGETVTVGSERFQCPEALFKPSLHDMDSVGIPELINNSISACDEEIRKYLYGNIVLSGGTTMFEGMGDRMWKDVSALAPPDTKVKMISPPERKIAVWLGGSAFASQSSFDADCISKQQYEENGPSIVHGGSS